MVKKAKHKTASKYTVTCDKPAGDGIFDINAFEKFLHDRIKVAGRTNNLAGSVDIATSNGTCFILLFQISKTLRYKAAEKASSDHNLTLRPGSVTVVVEPAVPFSKRYLKYLTKKFLKKNQLRDWLRVVADSKGTYTLKYFNIEGEEAADEE